MYLFNGLSIAQNYSNGLIVLLKHVACTTDEGNLSEIPSISRNFVYYTYAFNASTIITKIFCYHFLHSLNEYFSNAILTIKQLLSNHTLQFNIKGITTGSKMTWIK